MSNPLTAVLPAKVRLVLYAIVFVAATVFAIYQATEGDWKLFTGSLLAALVNLLAAANTPAQQ